MTPEKAAKIAALVALIFMAILKACLLWPMVAHLVLWLFVFLMAWLVTYGLLRKP